MSLKKSTQKKHLESEYERYRAQAETARSENHYNKAARYYKECVDVLEQWAELESNQKLKEEQLELAENLKTAAKKLDNGEALTSDNSPSGGYSSASSGSGSATDRRDSQPQRQPDDDKIDPTSFLENTPEMDFGDVGGMTNLKETLKDQVIDPLKRPDLYEEYNLGVVNGVLLYGPPGTGKTFITKALAGELGYNFIEVQASDITSSLVGEAAKNMEEVFEVARNHQPCLLFMDEIDAIAAERKGSNNKTMSEGQMITQFLTEMSDIKGEDVIVVSATNLPDSIDGAAWRRFDERIEVPPPDATARAAVLRVHLRDRPVLTDKIDWDQIKKLTDGYSSSDLEIIASKAARSALKEARSEDEIVPITQQHLEMAIKETESSLDAWD